MSHKGSAGDNNTGIVWAGICPRQAGGMYVCSMVAQAPGLYGRHALSLTSWVWQNGQELGGVEQHHCPPACLVMAGKSTSRVLPARWLSGEQTTTLIHRPLGGRSLACLGWSHNSMGGWVAGRQVFAGRQVPPSPLHHAPGWTGRQLTGMAHVSTFPLWYTQ